MSTTISESELSRSLAEILDRVSKERESFVIERDGETVARLEPAGKRRGATARELAERLRNLRTGDPAFAGDLEDIQKSQARVSFEPWPD